MGAATAYVMTALVAGPTTLGGCRMKSAPDLSAPKAPASQAASASRAAPASPEEVRSASVDAAAPAVPGGSEPEITSRIPCQTNDDCWIDGSTPVARDPALKGRPFRACEDGEIVPVCFEGRCSGIKYGC